MDEGISRKPIEVSNVFKAHLTDVLYYTSYAFGNLQTQHYLQKIKYTIDTLPESYHVYPECRHIPTKSRMYRNIILDAHLIIYRITDERIEVLDIIHAASSISKIRGVRNVRL